MEAYAIRLKGTSSLLKAKRSSIDSFNADSGDVYELVPSKSPFEAWTDTLENVALIINERILKYQSWNQYPYLSYKNDQVEIVLLRLEIDPLI